MNYFIDTNIPLGYAISHDKWHNVSKTFLDNHQKDSIFWSNLVKNEYTKKFNEILDDINTFIANCKTLLKENQKDFINYFDFEDFLIKKTKAIITKHPTNNLKLVIIPRTLLAFSSNFLNFNSFFLFSSLLFIIIPS